MESVAVEERMEQIGCYKGEGWYIVELWEVEVGWKEE